MITFVSDLKDVTVLWNNPFFLFIIVVLLYCCSLFKKNQWQIQAFELRALKSHGFYPHECNDGAETQ